MKMPVLVERIEPIEEAFDRLRAAPLENAGKEQIRIYENAKFRISDFTPDELNLTSLYVLRRRLDSLRTVRAQLIDRYQIDILNLSSVLHMKNEEGQLFGMAPPVVEVYQESVHIIAQPGDREPASVSILQCAILKDGIHRGWIAREENLSIRCVVISGALKEYLPYAYPNLWSEVKVCDDPPSNKKSYRRQDPYTYMRPLKVLRQTGGSPPQAEWGR